jgi:tetratricopeptide (TPR) repeat protein
MYAIQKSEFENKGISAELEAKKLLCYRGLRKYEEGVFEYETQLNLPYKQSPRIGLQASLLYYSLDNNQSTINVLDNIVSKEISDFFAIHSIRGIAQARLGNYDTAIEDFNTLSSLATNQYSESIQLLNELRMQHKKSKVMAEVLSIIPGLGYWYSGHPKSAITSLLVNCALGYATYTSIKTENYGVAGLCGFFAMSFYIGNITGAGKSAERYNIRKQQETIAKLEKINQIYLIN